MNEATLTIDLIAAELNLDLHRDSEFNNLFNDDIVLFDDIDATAQLIDFVEYL